MSNLHPIFAEALAPFAPKPMRAFQVRIFRAGRVVNAFECMAPDSVTAVNQCMDLLAPGDKLDVMGLDAFRELGRDRRALELQVRANDVERVCNGDRS